tara:strand:+ start:653 stop:1489 length:837 start_codon:yes stop_codon:yes gene_type:complete
MEVKFKSALVAVPLLLMISCSGPEEKMDSKIETVEPNPSWDATNSIMYNEFLQCSSGQEYSQDALDEMIKAWRDLELPESILGAWGYSSLNDNNEIIIDQWEISWTSKESAEKSWEEWAKSENAITWSEKYTSVLQCDSENRLGYDFLFPHDPYAFGPTPENGSFVATFSTCQLNEGMQEEDLSNEIIKYNNWLDTIDPATINGFYAYGIYFPVGESGDEDFKYGNFFETLQTISDIDNAWEESPEKTSDLNQEISTCSNPELSNGQVFYDPQDPNFS